MSVPMRRDRGQRDLEYSRAYYSMDSDGSADMGALR
jgi:hypothetical protein